MRETITMWRDTRMIMLVAVIAAVYAAVLIPFKTLTIVPGITSIRPANVFPVIFSIMFGPAAAWGSAVGNLIGDIFGGTLGPGSLGGFIGNFFFGFIGYKLWGNLGPLSSGEEPTMRSGRQIVEYLIIALVSAAITAAIIAWGLELFGLYPFSVLGTIIVINNLIAAAVLGPPLLYLTYPRVKKLGLLYPDVMRADDLPDVGRARQGAVAAGFIVVSIVWLVVGITISVGVESVPFLAAPGGDVARGTGGSSVQIVLGAVAFAIILGLTSLSGERLSDLLQ